MTYTNTVVRVLEGTDPSNQRVTLLWREDRPRKAVRLGVGYEDKIRAQIDNAITRRTVCAWPFAESPLSLYAGRTVLAEYNLAIKGK